MPRGLKWRPSDLPDWFSDIPKATLFVIARQLGALASGTGDDLATGEYRIIEEWRVQYENGLVPQKPPADWAEWVRNHWTPGDPSTR